jgi:hypothetical protein
MGQGMRMAMVQGWQLCKDDDGAGMAINDGDQQWQSTAVIDNG